MHKSKKIVQTVNIFILLVLFSTIGINQYITIKISKVVGARSIIGSLAEITLAKSGSLNGSKLSGDIMNDAIRLVISKGVPEVYGAELGVSYDDIQTAINIIKQYDPTYGKDKKIVLTGDNLNRYIDIGLRISCEYCCSAKSIINKDGKAACGCAHSWAMRGLAAYLLQNHADKYTNDEILREMTKWKGMYFPKQMIKKMADQLQSGTYTPDIASLVLDVKLPDYGGGGNGAPLPSEIENLPSMVGGC